MGVDTKVRLIGRIEAEAVAEWIILIKMSNLCFM